MRGGLENKLLYGTSVHSQAPDGRVWLDDGSAFPTLKLDGQGRANVTVVAYGGIVDDVEEAVRRAFEHHDIICEVLVPTPEISPAMRRCQAARAARVIFPSAVQLCSQYSPKFTQV